MSCNDQTLIEQQSYRPSAACKQHVAFRVMSTKASIESINIYVSVYKHVQISDSPVSVNEELHLFHLCHHRADLLERT